MEEIQAEELEWDVTVTEWLTDAEGNVHNVWLTVPVNAGADFASLSEAEQLAHIAAGDLAGVTNPGRAP